MVGPKLARLWKKAVIRSKIFVIDEEGHLYRRTDDLGTQEDRLCMPIQLVGDVLSDGHDAPAGGGHSGLK